MLSGMSLLTKVIAPIVTLLPIVRLLPIIEVPTPRSTLSPIVILGLEFSFFTPTNANGTVMSYFEISSDNYTSVYNN